MGSHTKEEYEKVMSLVEKIGKRPRLLARMTGIPLSTVCDWIYYRYKPFCISERWKKRNKEFGAKIRGHPNYNVSLKGCFTKGHKSWNVKIPKDGYEKLTAEKAYVLGVLCGDGSLHIGEKNYQYVVQLNSLQSCDKDFAEAFADAIEATYGLKCTVAKTIGYGWGGRRKCLNVRIYSKIVTLDLVRYDPSGGGFKTATWRVPKEIFYSGLSIKAAFIRGFADSEGSVSKSQNIISLYSSNLAGLYDILKLLQDLGINGKVYSSKRAFVLNIRGIDNLKRFKETVNFTIKRKKENLKHLLRHYSTDLSCPACGKRFVGNDALRRLKIHCFAKHHIKFEALSKVKCVSPQATNFK